MRDKLTNYVNSRYNDVIVWEYSEFNGTCYLRFTTKNDVYIATAPAAGSHVTIFKGLENELL